MNNHSLLSADKRTHVKIVALAAIAGLVLMTVGLTAKSPDGTENTRYQTQQTVVKAGKPSTFTSTTSNTIR